MRPQAWWTPIGLLAVIGPSRKLQRSARRRSGRAAGRTSAARATAARISCSWATRSGFELTGRNIGPRLGRMGRAGRRASHVGGPTRRNPSARRYRGSGYPTRDAAAAAGAAARGRRSAVRRRVPVADLPRSRPRLCRRLEPGASGSPRLPILVARADRRGRAQLGAPELRRPASSRSCRPLLILNLLFLAYRVVAAVDAYRVAAYLNAVDGLRWRPLRAGRRSGSTRCRSPACSPSAW